MQIKGMDGQSYNVTGAGQGTYNSIGASAGILALLQNGGLGGILGGGAVNPHCGCSENMPVNRYELNLTTALASKDGEIALLKADKYTDEKIVEATKYLQGEIGKVSDRLESFKTEQGAINLNQATLNATATASIQCMQANIAALQAITKTYIPSSNVCQSDCCGCVSAQ